MNNKNFRIYYGDNCVGLQRISYLTPAPAEIQPYFYIQPQPDSDARYEARFEHILVIRITVSVWLSHKFKFLTDLDNLLLSRPLRLSFHKLNFIFILDNNILFAVDSLIVMINMVYSCLLCFLCLVAGYLRKSHTAQHYPALAAAWPDLQF